MTNGCNNCCIINIDFDRNTFEIRNKTFQRKFYCQYLFDVNMAVNFRFVSVTTCFFIAHITTPCMVGCITVYANRGVF